MAPLASVRLGGSTLVCALLAGVAHAAPTIDLVDNQTLVHLYADGLVVPFAGEGFRKYSQEYSAPWGAVVAHGGQTGRMLGNRAAILTLPVETAGEHTLRVRVHGLAVGQKLSAHWNGKPVKNTSIEPDWQVVLVPLAAADVKAGENELRLTLGKRGNAGGASGYALIHSLELVPGATSEPGAYPDALPGRSVAIAGASKRALAGFGRLGVFVEVPAAGKLQLQTGVREGEGQFTVRVESADGKSKPLLEHKQGPGWKAHDLALTAHAGKLVRLWLESRGPATAWGEPRIVTPDAKPADVRRFKNAILVVVDALRSDRLEVYGKTRVATPNFTREARQSGVVFLHNQAASPSSPPSHGSIQTGMIPRVHGVAGDKDQLKPGTPMISSQLADRGFATAYYGNNPFGMARLERPGKWTEFHQPNQEGKGIDCTVLIPEMLGFANRQAKAGKRFFISSLPYEPHTPYRYHQGISDKYHKGSWDPPVGKVVDGDLLGKLIGKKLTLTDSQWNQLKALYDGEVEHMDGCFGALMAGLRESGLWKDTLVVVTADHGEGMYEHGYMGHAWGHHGEVGNVPLILIGDGLVDAGLAVDVVSSHLDIAPTILDLLGVPPSAKIQGMSLVPLVARRGQWTPRVVSLEYGRSYALRSREHRYIVDYAGKESLFDLARDPGEHRDLVGKDRFALRYMRDLVGFFLVHRGDWRVAGWGDLNNRAPGFNQAVLRN